MIGKAASAAEQRLPVRRYDIARTAYAGEQRPLAYEPRPHWIEEYPRPKRPALRIFILALASWALLAGAVCAVLAVLHA